MNLLQFAVLGLATGSVYALISGGLLVTYRGSGVINLAQGAMAMVGAYAYYQISVLWELNAAVGIAAAAVSGALLGCSVQWLVLRRMRGTSPLMRVIATLAVLMVLQAVAELVYGVDTLSVPAFLPTGSVEVVSGITVGQDRLVLLGIGVVMTVALWWLYRATHFGRLTAAVAENETVAIGLGYSPDTIATANWAIGCGLGALAGALVAPTVSLQPSHLVQLVIPALIVGLVARFSSFPMLLAAAMGLGVIESVMSQFVSDANVTKAFALSVAILILVIRGRALPLRNFISDRLPRVGDGRASRVGGLVAAIGLVVAMSLLPLTWSSALTVTLGFAVICLSVVLVTGYAGQLSLCQYTLAGLGALVTVDLLSDRGWPFVLAIAGGVLATMVVGIVVGVAALRTRGMTLAIVTLASGLILYYLVLNNGDLNGGPNGTTINSLSVFGLELNPLFEPQRYGIFASVCLVGTSVALLNLRRGRTGRRLLAVRSNERGSVALGISVTSVKLYAFAIGAGIAALGGIILAFRNFVVLPDQFTTFTAITLVGVTVVGGVGYVGGGVIGATLMAGGIGSVILQGVKGLDTWLPLISGLILLMVLLTEPSGLWAMNVDMAHKILARAGRLVGRAGSRHCPDQQPALFSEVRPVESRTLEVRDLTVRFGGVTALDSVALTVRPGEIHGLIGPNGAGKTTFIDGVTGLVACERGSVKIAEADAAAWSPVRRANAGVARSFQSLELFEDLTVEENLAVASDSWAVWRYLTDLVWPGRMRLDPSAAAIAEQLGLTRMLSLLPSELSLGDRKLVSIARAVVKRPSVLLLDEPAAGLSDAEARTLGVTLRDLADSMGIGVLLVEHNVDMVISVCDVITVLVQGAVLASGPPGEISTDSRVLAAYLGDSENPDEEPAKRRAPDLSAAGS